MPNIKLLNHISQAGLSGLTSAYQIVDELKDADAILVRSEVMHDITLDQRTLAVARAGAGVNNIPLDQYAEQGVVVFNTPGANANAVKELTLAGLLLAMRDIVGGINDLKARQDDKAIDKTVEKIKSAYAGYEIRGKTIGIIGLGMIGMMVAQAAAGLGMHVIGTKRNLGSIDPDALSFTMKLVSAVEDIYQQADVISLNVPYNDQTKHMVGEEAFRHMRDGVIILNFARAGLVDDDALERAIKSQKVRRYVTDFPNHKTNNMDGVIAIPHLGASTAESEDNCAMMAANQVMAYLETGSIRNSVNYPDLCGQHGKDINRIVVLLNQAGQLDMILDELATIYADANRRFARNDRYAVIFCDMNTATDDQSLARIMAMKGVARVRVIRL